MAEHVGKRIAERRKAAHLTQAELEARAKLAPTALSKIEGGTRDITAGELRTIARVLRVEMTALLGEDSEEDQLATALLGLRNHCSLKQRKILAELFRSLADELAPVGTN